MSVTEPLAPEDWTTKMTLLRALATGAAAGAAGTTALNATTYVDMAVRGRPSSSTPEATVEKGADTIGVTVPGDEETRSNRLQGLGPLSGIVTGVGVGAFAGALRAARLPGPIAALLVGGAAMAVSDGLMTALGVTDPRRWTPASWASDVVPHLAFGGVTVAVLAATDTRGAGGARTHDRGIMSPLL